MERAHSEVTYGNQQLGKAVTYKVSTVTVICIWVYCNLSHIEMLTQAVLCDMEYLDHHLSHYCGDSNHPGCCLTQ